MSKLLLIDGNSIMNRAFYGILANKMLTSKSGICTNAVYGFLAIMFKIMDELEPEYMAVSFDLKGPTKRHQMYEGYKANRHGMPDELAEQMPIIKEVLEAMKIDIAQKEGYEGDDVLGTLARYGTRRGLDVVILSGDKDTFQLATDKVTIRIPHTKAGKTETNDYDKQKIIEEYGLQPRALIEVKGLQGDTSDNIPGVPGIGPKTAINIIKKYGTIEKMYEAIDEGKDEFKGKLKESIVNNKEQAILSRKLGIIDTKVPLDMSLEELKVEGWDKAKVLELFEELNFKRYIERFNLKENEAKEISEKLEEEFTINKEISKKEVIKKIKELKKCIYYLGTIKSDEESKIIKKEIDSISIYNYNEKQVYCIKNNGEEFHSMIKEVFEDETIQKYGFEMNFDYIILKQEEITMKNLKFDASVAAYILNSTDKKYPIDKICEEYLKLDIENYLKSIGIEEQNMQITLFDNVKKEDYSIQYTLYAYCIGKLSEKLTEELEKKEELELFETIDMPTIEVLSDMQWNGMYVEEAELAKYGETLKEKLDILIQEIHKLAKTEFNVNSPKQLGEVLFEKLKLPIIKKTKNGYSTDVDVLEKLRGEHPIIEKILDYRQLAKLDSTYVKGLTPFINKSTKRIHSFFHQTITATGRISSTEPNLQNIPTRIELGKKLRKIFKAEGGKIYIDADYSQIELRVLAHLSKDKHMIKAFKNGEDIHTEVASQVLGIPPEEVTKKQRNDAKAINFGIVYGISDYGLGEQLGIGRKSAKEYIDQYLTKYSGIRQFMKDSVKDAKEKGYTSTMFNRKREIKELSSNNYSVRQFGERAAMNTPVQGTAADIMKIAMIKVFKELQKRNLKTKIVLQVHDEMMLETPIEEKDEVKKILREAMENAVELDVPLVVEISEAENWYECK